MQPTKEKDSKVRVFALAKELNLETKVLLEFCKELGFTTIKNQLNVLEPEQAEALKLRAKKGPRAAAPSSAPPVAPPAKSVVPPKLDSKIPTLSKPKILPSRPSAGSANQGAVTPPSESLPQKSETVPVDSEAPAVPATPTDTVTPPAVASEVLTVPPPQEPVGSVPSAVEEIVEPKPSKPIEPISTQPQPSESQQQKEPAAESATPSAVAPTAPAVTAAPGMPTSGRIPSMPLGRPMNLNAGGRPMNLNAPRSPLAGQRPSGQTPTPTTPPASSTGRPAPVVPPRGTPPRETGTAGGSARPASGLGGQRPSGPSGLAGTGRPGGLTSRTATPSTPPSGPTVMPARPTPRPPVKGQMKLTPDQIERLRRLEQQRGLKRIDMKDIESQLVAAPVNERGGPLPVAHPGRPPGPVRIPGKSAEDTEDDRKGAFGKKPGEVAGRDARHKSRQEKGRQRGPTTDRAAVIIGAGGRVDTIEERFGSRIKKHRGKQQSKRPTTVIAGKVEISLPITVRSLSESIGVKVGELILKLKQETNALYTINSNVEFLVAELIAAEKGIELVAKKQESAEDIVLREVEERRKAREQHLVPRPPIVTIMGHVDHGKTSLLDKIRQEYGFQSDVVSSEAGGITQVLRAWRVEKDGHPITFLDTPGHEAFTKMRARGANVTDIAVIVVSAADGIMPQTQEAVNHAKAADVDIIVAINKCDLPGAQPEKVKSRLYELELVPEDMGGDVPVIFTSAITGQGIGELLDNIALRAEFAELKADPDQPATGTCLEAYQSADEGVLATLLVGNGTLHRGDVLLCGSTYGRVRAMYNDLGQAIDEASPSTPVRITGLNEVPDADDPFYVVDNITTAREIAEKRRALKLEADRTKFSPVSLDKLREATTKSKITELKVILKAEARGSVEAIKKELEKLVHEEVRTRVLHAGIGAITESDVTLALTSPADTIIVGFNVTSDDAAMKLAEHRGVVIREYQIIYNLVDDIKAALEGRLKPIEEIVHLGRAVVRETFKISKVGTIAGCYVTSGTIERSAKVRVIREGTVIYPPPDKVATLESLKRFKDDVKEVREGFECGMKLAGFDDIKVNDVIEAFKIETKQRTL